MRAPARALVSKMYLVKKAIFGLFQTADGRRRGFRARNRARPYGARQSILRNMDMFFDYLIASVAQKALKIGTSEVLSKNAKSGPPWLP